MSTLVSPNDNVIVTWPAYQSLYEVAQARGAKLHKWSCRQGKKFDVEDLEEDEQGGSSHARMRIPADGPETELRLKVAKDGSMEVILARADSDKKVIAANDL